MSQSIIFSNINNKSSCIYSLGIYIDFGIIYYTREYKKLLLIISNIFPLFRFVLYFFKCFTQHVKMSIIKSRLVGLIFENRSIPKANLFKFRRLNQMIDEKNKIKYLSVNDDPKEYMANKNKDPPLSENKSIIEPNNKDIDKDKEKKSNNKSNNKSLLMNSVISLNNNNLINILNRKEMININSKNVPVMPELSVKPKEDFTNKPNKIEKNPPKKNSVFPFHFFFLDFYFDRLINPQQFHSISKKYFTVYNFMSQIYDISTHILLMKQFNLVNNGLKQIYEQQGFCPARPFKKININNNELMEKLSIELNKKGKSVIFSKNLQ